MIVIIGIEAVSYTHLDVYKRQEQLLSPEKYVGRAPEQTAEFLSDYVKPILDKYSDIDNNADEINV